MTKLRLWLIALVFPLLWACSSTPYFEEQTLTDPGKALVYVYRPKATNPGKKPMRYSYPDIQVDYSEAVYEIREASRAD